VGAVSWLRTLLFATILLALLVFLVLMLSDEHVVAYGGPVMGLLGIVSLVLAIGLCERFVIPRSNRDEEAKP
jgi:hypothetical protein